MRIGACMLFSLAICSCTSLIVNNCGLPFTYKLGLSTFLYVKMNAVTIRSCCRSPVGLTLVMAAIEGCLLSPMGEKVGPFNTVEVKRTVMLQLDLNTWHERVIAHVTRCIL